MQRDLKGQGVVLVFLHSDPEERETGVPCNVMVGPWGLFERDPSAKVWNST